MTLRDVLHRPEFSIYVGVGAGIVYGVLVRFAFAFNRLQNFWSVMTIGFIFLVPLALGFLTVHYGEAEERRGWPYRIFMPWVPCWLLMTIACFIGWEGWICIVMVSPVFLVMSSVGGVVAGLVNRRRETQSNSFPALIFFAALPFISASIESRLGLPASMRTVETTVQINSSSTVVWQNIERVREIQSDEHRPSLFHSLGFPRPVEATLSREGVGGIRHATFEGGVLFIETIKTWEPEHELSFNIQADSASVPATTLDEHVNVGGQYFDVLEGRYTIERTNDGQVLLHLSSKHRLSTRFNLYAGLWTDLIMRDIQRNILDIIKRRCESAS